MLQEINQRLNDLLSSLKEGKVKDAMQYSLSAKGKRLRPMLMLKVIQAHQMDYHPYIDLACAIEMIHTYSLIHDDLPAMDDDDLRRGMKTCHKMFDEATAILAGDALLTHAFSIISESDVIDDSKKVQLIKILASSAGQNGMIYGQQQDLYFESKKANIDELKDIHFHKTGKLIIAPLLMGAIISDDSNLDVYEQLGMNIGIGFQIQDDVLDIIGDESKLGKKIGSDIENDKSTYVSLYGLEKSKELIKEYFTKAYENIYGLQINHGILLEIIDMIYKRDY